MKLIRLTRLPSLRLSMALIILEYVWDVVNLHVVTLAAVLWNGISGGKRFYTCYILSIFYNLQLGGWTN